MHDEHQTNYNYYNYKNVLRKQNRSQRWLESTWAEHARMMRENGDEMMLW